MAPGADNTLAFVEGDLSIKVMNRGGLLRAPARSAWATIELAEYEDPDEFAKAMNEALREVLA